MHEQLGEQLGIASVTGNIGIVYMYQGLYEQALEYYHNSLLIHEELGGKAGKANAIGNIGIVYMYQGSYEQALEYNYKALLLHQQLDNKSEIATVTANIGLVYWEQALYGKSLEYLQNSLLLYEQIGDKIGIASNMGDIGAIYAKPEYNGYSVQKSEEYLLLALTLNNEIGSVAQNITVYQTLATLYEQDGQWQKAIESLKKYHALEKEINSEEIKKKAQQYDHQRKIAERERELAIQQAAADAKHAATQILLHKVLPDVIAKRMVEGEVEIADYYECVTILFADIEGFTPMSAKMPANIVVRLLNHIFSEFDHIMKKHGCEKIKTIGDGYMAIAGAPVVCDDHAERMAAAAVDMLGALELPDELLTFVPQGTRLNIRIGIHTGAVVAGVVGEDRFVYDVYSDAVNTAARMESHGESGLIHVSSDYVQHLQSRMVETNSYTFESRGVIEVKGKGRMETFFLERV